MRTSMGESEGHSSVKGSVHVYPLVSSGRPTQEVFPCSPLKGGIKRHKSSVIFFFSMVSLCGSSPSEPTFWMQNNLIHNFHKVALWHRSAGLFFSRLLFISIYGHGVETCLDLLSRAFHKYWPHWTNNTTNTSLGSHSRFIWVVRCYVTLLAWYPCLMRTFMWDTHSLEVFHTLSHASLYIYFPPSKVGHQ